MNDHHQVDQKTGLPPPYTQAGGFPQQQGNIPPPPPGTFVHTGPVPPGTYPGQPVPGTYGSAPVGGYQAQPGGYVQAPPQQQTYYFSSYTPSGVGSMQTLIPVMPMWVAITLCIVNCLLPGFGTMIAGMTVCCCVDMQHHKNSSMLGLFCINFWLGWLQLIMVFFLVGWAWSIMWGVLFIMISDQYYGKPPQNAITPTTTTVIQQTAVAPQQVP